VKHLSHGYGVWITGGSLKIVSNIKGRAIADPAYYVFGVPKFKKVLEVILKTNPGSKRIHINFMLFCRVARSTYIEINVGPYKF